jgi:DNA-binding transcriptional MocR family regulator
MQIWWGFLTKNRCRIVIIEHNRFCFMKNISVQQEEFLYIRISDLLENHIRNRTLKTGEKLPSVRSLSREQGVSMSTAFKAYAHLEDKGLIEARPKSGYYVRFSPRESLPVPSSQILNEPLEKGSVDEMIAQVFRHIPKEGVVRLSIAAPALSLLPKARLKKSLMEAVRSSPDNCVAYEQLQGNEQLRRQIARQALNWGGSITEEEVVTTQGCMEALVFCLKAVTQPGDTVAIESPTYFGIFNIMKTLGLKVMEIPTHPEHGVELDYLERALEGGEIKACLFVPNFSNPAGSCMPLEHKKRLVSMLAEREIPLIEDDIYGELYFGKSRPHSCKSFDRKGLVLLCSSVSKSLAPGYRVGWCIPGRFKEKVLSLKLMHTVSSAAPTHAAVGHFFETGRFDLHMRKLRKALHTQCLHYIQAISAHFPEDSRISHPQGGYVLWVELNRRINAFELYKEAMEQGISISPGQIFSAQPIYAHYIRISFGAPLTPEIDQSLKVLGRLVKRMSGKD